MSRGLSRRLAYLVCMIVIGLLYIISVPWYRDGDAPLRLWLGLPDWVAVALLCYVGVAIANAVAWSVTDVPDAPDVSDLPEGSTDNEAPL
jgi:hypothetical protein